MKNKISLNVRRLANFSVITLVLAFLLNVSTNFAADNNLQLNGKSEKLHPTNSIKINLNNVNRIEFVSELEQKAFEILNKIRAEKGLHKLAWNEDMAKIARLHSRNMAKYKFFSHSGVDGLSVNDRADSLGIYDWSAIGENIAYSRGYENPAEFTCANWMKSPSHRDNLLSARWQESAVGVAKALDGTYYFTQVFFLK